MDLGALVSSNISSGNPVTYIFVFAAGVLTGFTPCILPVVPIIVGYIGAQQNSSRFRSFLTALAYVGGMSVTFTALGIFAALTGSLFGRVQTNPWTQVIMGNVVLFMAMWFMDIIHIPLPVFSGIRTKEKGLLPAFLLGLASGLIAAPCTAAILAVLLAYVGTSQNIIFGGSLLFVYALGMGMVFLIAGTFTGALTSLISSENASKNVKRVFGILLFLFSQYFFIQAGRLF